MSCSHVRATPWITAMTRGGCNIERHNGLLDRDRPNGLMAFVSDGLRHVLVGPASPGRIKVRVRARSGTGNRPLDRQAGDTRDTHRTASNNVPH